MVPATQLNAAFHILADYIAERVVESLAKQQKFVTNDLFEAFKLELRDSLSRMQSKRRLGPSAERYLRWDDVTERVGLSRVTIWRLERRGEFPKRRQLGSASVGWLESEVEDWLRRRPVTG